MLMVVMIMNQPAPPSAPSPSDASVITVTLRQAPVTIEISATYVAQCGMLCYLATRANHSRASRRAPHAFRITWTSCPHQPVSALRAAARVIFQCRSAAAPCNPRCTNTCDDARAPERGHRAREPLSVSYLSTLPKETPNRSPTLSFSKRLHILVHVSSSMADAGLLSLAQKKVWKIARKIVCSVICGIAQLFDVLVDSYQRVVHKSRPSGSFFATKRDQFAARQSVDIEIRGLVVLKWLVTCFSAVAILMMQGTVCVRLDGLGDSNFGGNWIYDGRVSCFSNSGEVLGLWQVASVFGVALVIIAPAAFLRIMRQIAWTEKRFRTHCTRLPHALHPVAAPPIDCRGKLVKQPLL